MATSTPRIPRSLLPLQPSFHILAPVFFVFRARILVSLRLPSCVFSFSQVSIVGIGHEFKTFDGEEVQQYIDLMDKDEIAEAPAADPAMQE
jgi:hypothetical protein